MHTTVLRLWTGALLLALPGCKIVDRVKDGGAPADTAAAPPAAAGPLVLRLESPGTLAPDEQGTVRVTITNRGDSVPGDVRLELFLPGWLEPTAPPAGGREVTVTTSEAEGIRLAYRLDDPPLRPGKTEVVEQGVRIPPASLASRGARPWGRVVRARLTGPGGRAITEVESGISFDSLAVADSAATPADTAAAAAGAPRDRLGPARLGMTSAALRQAAPGARDTAWTREGMAERGMVLLVGGGRALALLAGDTVGRIEVRDPAARTREGLGVGSRFSELRTAYGTPCADVAGGEVVVWFPRAPGVSFALDVPPPRDPRLARAQPDRVPATARVTRWWLRRGADRCASP